MRAIVVLRNKILTVVISCFFLGLVVNGQEFVTTEGNVASILISNSNFNLGEATVRPLSPSAEQIPSTQQAIQLVLHNSSQLPAALVTTTTTISTKESLNVNEGMTVTPASQGKAGEDSNNCPQLSKIPGINNLSQDEFITKLTDACRYDKLIKPPSDGPLYVDMQIDMKHIESADHLQFKTHILVQLHYQDSRLNYSRISPDRGNILGEEPLRDKIWVPHIIIHNERESSLMGLDGKDVFVHIDPNGEVRYAYRMTTTFYCWMNLQKFPFDYQICQLQWISWAYNATNLHLKWKKVKPFQVASNLHLTEFVLEDRWVEEIFEPASFDSGGLFGNFSALLFKFKLKREAGFYIMDYFVPSILLVCTSWVTFWLQADAGPPRAVLGTSTMLSFITLNGGLSKNLPKVSYIKASEIWFMGCTTFIFCSLAEFAFVNVIWRRKKKVELKKQNSKHILKGALTPSLARKQLRRADSANSLYKTRSCTSLDLEKNAKNTQANYLTVHSFPSTLNVPTIITHSQDDLVNSEDSVTTIPIPDNASRPPTPPPWTTMTPQEVANWIDRKSRLVFPVAFIIFNLFYWSFVYAL